MKELFSNGQTREQREILLTQYIWDFPDKDDLKKNPFDEKEKYISPIAARAMNNFAKSLFKKICSEIGFCYREVKQVFLSQNAQFFDLIELLEDEDEVVLKGDFLEKMCRNLIVPKVHRVDRVIKEIKGWSPEEQAEALQLIAGKKIKITIEDI